MKEHIPGLSAPCLTAGKGGDTRVCFSWRDTGKCYKTDNGDCPYDHPLASKGKSGKGKGDSKGKGKGKKGKSKGKATSDSGGRSHTPDPKGRQRSESPKKTVITDPAKLCRAYLKGECRYGKSCNFHHNPSCKFIAAGKPCARGDKCPFPHWNAKPTAPSMPASSTDGVTAPKTAAGVGGENKDP